MKRVFRVIFGLIFDRFAWKVLSLAVAIVIWATVASEPELSNFASTQVEYKNLPDDLEIASNPITTIFLELRGPSGELQGLGGQGIHPQVILDLSSATPGEHTYAILDNVAKLPSGVRVISAVPAEVHLNFETRETRTVPVRVRFAGEGANGYVVQSAVVTPPAKKIEGAASHVETTAEVVTDPVDVANAVGTQTFRVTAFVGDPFVHMLSSPQVVVTVTMKKEPPAAQSPGKTSRGPARAPH
jgi:YbbR domain-containing protein